jgi:hypothetical protein
MFFEIVVSKTPNETRKSVTEILESQTFEIVSSRDTLETGETEGRETMVLHCNAKYKLVIKTGRKTKMTATMTYCGGGMVDDNGHWVGGGVWCKPEIGYPYGPHYQFFEEIPILYIVGEIK